MMTKLLQFLMRRTLIKNWGKRCSEYKESCGNCIIWKAYEYMFYPYSGNPKTQEKFMTHLKNLTYSEAEYEAFDKEKEKEDLCEI